MNDHLTWEGGGGLCFFLKKEKKKKKKKNLSPYLIENNILT
jgi:hypothetical protein